jgi:hypothetical protein
MVYGNGLIHLKIQRDAEVPFRIFAKLAFHKCRPMREAYYSPLNSYANC